MSFDIVEVIFEYFNEGGLVSVGGADGVENNKDENKNVLEIKAAG